MGIISKVVLLKIHLHYFDPEFRCLFFHLTPSSVQNHQVNQHTLENKHLVKRIPFAPPIPKNLWCPET